MSANTRQLFELEARDIDPKWQALEKMTFQVYNSTTRLSFAPDLQNVENVPANFWPQPETANWAATAAAWMQKCNKALGDQASAGESRDQWDDALERRVYTNGKRLQMLVNKGVNVQGASWLDFFPHELMQELKKKFEPFGNLFGNLPVIIGIAVFIAVLWWISKRD